VTRRLLVAATLVQSILAGTNVNGLLVTLPAWEEVGARSWAEFSRHADLSRRGLTLYPASAFLGLFLSLAAAISFRRDRRRLAASPVPVYGAVLMSAAGLLVTAKAAPNMLRLRRLASDDEAGLRQALSGFHFWSAVRGAFQVLGFVATVWSLATISRDSPHL
jgi:hypothetical protein